MTRDETHFLLARISRCFGRKPPDATTVDEWLKFLGDVPVTVAHDMLDRLVRQGGQGPSLSTFVDVCRSEQRRLATGRRPLAPVVPEEPPVSHERAMEHITAIRAQLGTWTKPGIRHAAPTDEHAEDLW